MKWIGGRESSNVDDRRGMSAGGLAVGGGVIGLLIYLINMFLGEWVRNSSAIATPLAAFIKAFYETFYEKKKQQEISDKNIDRILYRK